MISEDERSRLLGFGTIEFDDANCIRADLPPSITYQDARAQYEHVEFQRSAAGRPAEFDCSHRTVESGTSVEFKSTDTSQFEAMKNQMMKNMQTKAHTKKPAPPKKEAEEKKP